MAKRKTPKSEKIVDLKPKAEKVTEEQLTKMQNIVNAINQGQQELGRLELQKPKWYQELCLSKKLLVICKKNLKKSMVK